MSTNRTIQTNAIDGVQVKPNFITNGSASTTSTLGYSLYVDTAGASPVTGTGTGTNTITFTTSSVTPLSGDNSFIFTKPSSNAQGQGVSYAFSIDNASKAKVMTISMDLLVQSGTFAVGTSTTPSDVTIWIRDVTNNTIIQPSQYSITQANSTVSSSVNASFQTSSNSTSYQLILHVGTTSALAYTLQLDNISVSPFFIPSAGTTTAQVRLQGHAGYGSTNTKIARFTNTFDNYGSAITYADSSTLGASFTINEAGVYAIAYTLDGTSATGVGGPGISLNTTQPTVSIPTVGVNGSKEFLASDIFNGAAGSKLSPGTSTWIGNLKVGDVIRPHTQGITPDQTGLSYFTIAKVGTIAGAGDGSVIEAEAHISTNFSATTGNPINFDTVDNDTNGLITTGTGWKFSPTASGQYFISMFINQNSTSAVTYYIYKGGVKTKPIAFAGSTVSAGAAGGTAIKINAGESIDIRPDGNIVLAGGTLTGAAPCTITIFKLSGGVTIGSGAPVAFRYYGSSTAIGTTDTTIIFNTKDFDNNSLVSLSTGVFTVQTSGQYQFDIGFATSISGGPGQCHVAIYKGSTIVSETFGGTVANAGNNSDAQLSDVLTLNAGDQITIRGFSSNGTGTVVNNTRTKFSAFLIK